MIMALLLLLLLDLVSMMEVVPDFLRIMMEGLEEGQQSRVGRQAAPRYMTEEALLSYILVAALYLVVPLLLQRLHPQQLHRIQ